VAEPEPVLSYNTATFPKKRRKKITPEAKAKADKRKNDKLLNLQQKQKKKAAQRQPKKKVVQQQANILSQTTAHLPVASSHDAHYSTRHGAHFAASSAALD
jgi:hypothetical protein